MSRGHQEGIKRASRGCQGLRVCQEPGLLLKRCNVLRGCQKNVKTCERVSRVAKRMSRGCQLIVKRVSRIVKRVSRVAKRVTGESTGWHEGHCVKKVSRVFKSLPRLSQSQKSTV